MFPRFSAPRIDRALARSPAVAILGPRQVGKTTLARDAAAARPGSAPTVTKGFWHACEDVGVSEAWVVAPIREGWPIGDRARVMSPLEMPLEDLG